MLLLEAGGEDLLPSLFQLREAVHIPWLTDVTPTPTATIVPPSLTLAGLSLLLKDLVITWIIPPS